MKNCGKYGICARGVSCKKPAENRTGIFTDLSVAGKVEGVKVVRMKDGEIMNGKRSYKVGSVSP